MNRFRKGLLSITLAAASAISLCIVSSAAETSTKQVVIELEAVAEEKEHFRPKEDVDYTLTLKNKLGPSWLRVKFDFSSKNIDKGFTDSDLNIRDGWIRQGEYFYYTRKAEAYTDYTVVKGIRIPDAGQIEDGASVTISVYGEAVRYDGFKPDFSSKTPWEGAEISHTASVSGSSRSYGFGSSVVKRQIYLYGSPQGKGNPSTGIWEQTDAENRIWKYKSSSGFYAKDGWLYVCNPYSPEKDKYDWFHFDKDGVMTYGWYKGDGGIWYYCHEESDGNLGMMVKGWHEDKQDGKRYFLDRKTGIMLSGWQEIDGDNYYFATAEEVPEQTWFWKTFGDTGLGKWLYESLGYRSYGSMYVNEATPDGQRVDEAGKRE